MYIFQSSKSGLSFYDISSNVSISESAFENIPNNGILYSPIVDGPNIFPQHTRTLSSFRFCDAEPVLFISPGEKYNFFSHGAQSQAGCARIFQTEPSYSIVVGIFATYSYRQDKHVASFYEGDKLIEDNKISTGIITNTIQVLCKCISPIISRKTTVHIV